jgi:predicted DNA-binding WGR domain protein
MRRFELSDGTSKKFWEVTRRGSVLVVRFGRLGTKGQERTTACASLDAADAAVQRLVREKTGKGYVERSPEPEAPRGAHAEVRGFSTRDSALFERGFPQMVVLTDTNVTLAESMRAAQTESDAMDPRLLVEVPRDTARRFVATMLAGRTWGYGPKVTIVALPERVAGRELALKSDRALDVDMLEQFFAAHIPWPREWTTEIGGVSVAVSENETYGWKLRKVVHVFEAFLGTEIVAERLRDHLLRAYREPEAWRHWGGDPWRHNAPAHHLALAFGTLRARLEPARWRELVAPFRGLESARLLTYADLLACFEDDTRAPQCPMYAMELALARRDRVAVRASLVAEGALWRPEIVWLLGSSALAGVKLGAARRLPDWKQVQLIEEAGRIALPEVALIVATLLSTRSGRSAASAWLREHADFAGPVVARAAEELPDAADRQRMQSALDVLGGAKVAASKTLDEAELQRELDDLFGALEGQLVACKGSSKKERAVMQAAFDRYCEARAAAGEVLPGAYFGRELIDSEGADGPTMARWMAHVDAVTR